MAAERKMPTIAVSRHDERKHCTVYDLCIGCAAAVCGVDAQIQRKKKQSTLFAVSVGDVKLDSFAAILKYIAQVGRGGDAVLSAEELAKVDRVVDIAQAVVLPETDVLLAGGGKLSKPLRAALTELNGIRQSDSGADTFVPVKNGQPTVADAVLFPALWLISARHSIKRYFPDLFDWLLVAEKTSWAIDGTAAVGLAKFDPNEVGAFLTTHQMATKTKGVPAKKAKEKVLKVTDTAFWTKKFTNEWKPAAKGPLPKSGKRNILITSALPYVNNVPHLGNIVGCVLSADIYARFCRLRDYNVIYVCGTDEYGTATETKAMEEKSTPQEVCDRYHKIHREIYEWFNISFDNFGRTSTPEQTKIAQELFTQNDANGFTTVGTIEQLYCNQDKRFLADRFIRGVCPHCGFDDTAADQCESCGKLLNATEMPRVWCKFCKQQPEVRQSDHVFLNLPLLQDEIDQFIEKSANENGWSSNAYATAKAWIREGLKERCITRDLKWGIPVPKKGFEDKVLYVWFDAPIGYISITACCTDWEKWWKNPEQVELVQFMGKDNIPFHTVMFPATLIGSRAGYTLLRNISTTEFLNYESGKFSKSRKTGVFGDDAKNSGIPAAVYRYYLAATRPEQSDSVFDWDDFASKNNADLRNTLGNFVNRCLHLTVTNFGGVVPEVDEKQYTDAEREVVKSVNEHLGEYVRHMDAIHIKDGVQKALAIAAEGNQYLQHAAPWDLLKSDSDADKKKRGAVVIALSVNIVRLLATVFQPFIPTVSVEICEQLNVPYKSLHLTSSTFQIEVPAGHKVGKPEPIFQFIGDGEVTELRRRYGGIQQTEFPMSVVTGVVLKAEAHPEANHLYVLEIDTSEKHGGVRTIVSALRAHYTPSQLVGHSVCVLTNLKATNFKGVKSNGMVLTACKGKIVSLLEPVSSVPPGTPVAPRGAKIVPKARFNVKTDFDGLNLHTAVQNGQLVVLSGAQPLLASGIAITAAGAPEKCAIR